MISGNVTHPKDLGPAIRALSKEAQAYLRSLERPITPQDIAKAADLHG